MIIRITMDSLVDETEDLRIVADLKVAGDVEPVLGVVVVNGDADLLLGGGEGEEGEEEEAGLDGWLVGVDELVSGDERVVDLDLIADLVQLRLRLLDGLQQVRLLLQQPRLLLGLSAVRKPHP